MSANWKRGLTAAMMVASFAGLPTVAVAADAVLYEVTENMTLDSLAKPTLRTASAALQGTANVGSPLCPNLLVKLILDYGLAEQVKQCVITAFGEDDIDLATGAGKLSGNFAVVVNGDNPVDAPELVVMTGEFQALMQVLVDMKATPPVQLPLIAITGGVFTPKQVFGMDVTGMPGFEPANFAGVFRLPFAVTRDGRRVRAGYFGREAYYLSDNGRLIRVKPNERSLGHPTVRVEVVFP